MPSTCRRPSVVGPPWLPNVIMPGFRITLPLSLPVMLGTSMRIEFHARTAGTELTISLLTTCCRFALWTSTIGVSPETVIVSSSAPTRISALTLAVKSPVSSIPSRLMVANPGSVKTTL